jgi:shikimate dehydrogenase
MSATELALIGHPLGHSLSPFIHQQLLAAAGQDGRYRLIDIPPENLAAAVPALLRDLDGFNVTIPFKEAIIPRLAGLDPSAARLRSVNTVWQGRGFNTDYQAFLNDCPPMAGHRVLILGAGGISRTIAFAAAESGAEICIIARRHEQADALASAVWTACPSCRVSTCAEVADWLETGPFDRPDAAPWALVNATPLGLWPNVAGLPFPASELRHFAWVYDTIYNPPATRLVLAARSQGIPARGGLGMLFDQALAAQRLWHPDADFPAARLQAIRQQLHHQVLRDFPLAILLTGFMGSGKTMTGSALARMLGLPFIDMDQAIADETGMTIPEIFARDGEPAFRALERQKLADLLKADHSQVIATGGGALIDPAAEAIARERPSLIFYLDTPLEEIRQRVGSGEGRPLIDGLGDDHMKNLFMARRSRYISLADFTAGGTGSPEEIAALLAAGLGFEGETT